MPLARSLAYRYSASSESIEDLIQVANLGLVKAVDRFNPELGASLVNYAVPTILGELRRHFRDRAFAVHVPRALQERVLAVDATSVSLAETLGRAPTVRELAEELGLRDEEVLEALHARDVRVPRALEHGPPGEDGTPPVERLGSTDSGFDRVEATCAARAAGLDEREWQILHQRFSRGMTQHEISRVMGISQMHVSRLMRGALQKVLAAVEARPAVQSSAR